ncbi:MAG TPA: hypothetical protein PK747_09690 [Acidobacteriota bacterium]|nr:hypothetical protein [Acidobacteriota bacterium]HQO20829.1 hypothetical protein [Acidobacteriota bacterium]HQQ47663.1 hypothetical protein [Acidobacteriota bacterium]
MITKERGVKTLLAVGGIATILGAIDPLEGSLLILPGSLLVMLAAIIGKEGKAITRYRTWTFILILIGVAAMWGMTATGGIGGDTGISMWWGLLIVPYLIGLPMALWGPGLPKWLHRLGIVPGLWYLAITFFLLKKAELRKESEFAVIALLVAVGFLIIGGCAWRLAKRVTSEK